MEEDLEERKRKDQEEIHLSKKMLWLCDHYPVYVLLDEDFQSPAYVGAFFRRNSDSHIIMRSGFYDDLDTVEQELYYDLSYCNLYSKDETYYDKDITPIALRKENIL